MKPSIALCLLLCGCGCQSERGFPPTGTIRNFDRVTPEVWRGAQPNCEGIRWLASNGCRTVVCLLPKSEYFPAEFQSVTNCGMAFESFPMRGWSLWMSATDKYYVRSVIRLIDTNAGPVFVHCLHGADRTSVVIECWKIKHGMNNADALREAEEYGLSRWEPGMRKFIRNFR